MAKRAFIHVGLPKCGSSSLQARLTSGREEALREGVFYPSPQDTASDPIATTGSMPMGHMLMATQLLKLSKARAAPEPSLLSSYVDQFRESGAHTLVLSSESLAKRIGRTKPELLAPLQGMAIEILLIYRRADALVLSSFKQAVRRRRYAGTFHAYAAQAEQWQDGLPNIPNLLDGILSRFPGAKLHVADLDAPGEARDSIDIGATLLRLPLRQWETTGLGPRDDVLVQRGLAVNASHTDEKTLYLLALNRTELDETLRREVDVALSAIPDDPIGSGVIMNRHDSRVLLRRFASLNADLADRFGLPLACYSVNADLPRGARRTELTADEAAVLTEQVLPLLSAEAASALKAVR